MKHDLWLDRFGMLGKNGELTTSRWGSREAVIRALQRDAKRRGRSPKMPEWRRATADHPSATTVRKMFGSWNRGLEAAGLKARPTGVNYHHAFWTRERIIEALQREYRQTGRPPGKTEWTSRGRPKDRPTSSTVLHVFGSWNAGLEAAGIPTRQPGESGPMETCRHGHPWTPDNIYTNPAGVQTCRACKRRRWSEWYRRKKARDPDYRRIKPRA